MSNHKTAARRGYISHASNWGWADYRTNAGWPADYDEWSQKDQRNYENGRLRAANVLAVFGYIPPRQDLSLVHSARVVGGRSIPERRAVR